MQHALNELCIAATKGAQETQAALKYFLNYFATHPEAEIIYRANDMRRVPAHSDFFITRGSHAAEVRQSPIFFEILRIEMKTYHIILTMGMY
jgi:hypothetical protein